MLLLAGLMGVLAVGATVLVGLEIMHAPDADTETDVAGEHAETADDQIMENGELSDFATDSIEAAQADGNADETGENGFAELGVSYGGILTDRPDETFSAAESAEALADENWLAATAPVHWLDRMHQSQVTGFSPEDDRLVIVYDDRVDIAPELTLEDDPENAALTHVMLNGLHVASVDAADGLTLAHITLVAESSLHRADAA